MAAKKSPPSVADWLSSRKPFTKCSFCLDLPTRDHIREILEAMATDPKFAAVTIREIHERLEATITTYSGTPSGLRRHLGEHERQRWSRAKGR